MVQTRLTAKKTTGGKAAPGQLARKAARDTRAPRYKYHAQTDVRKPRAHKSIAEEERTLRG